MVNRRIPTSQQENSKNVQDYADDPFKTCCLTRRNFRCVNVRETEALVRSLRSIIARATIAELILALSILAGCSSDKINAPQPIIGPSTAVEVPFCAGLEPSWVAFQDGNGAWTQALPVIAGQKVTFVHSFTADRGAIATVRLFRNGLRTLDVQYGLPAELAIVGDTTPAHCALPVSQTLLGTVAGIDTNEVAQINAGFGTRDLVALGEGNTDFALPSLIAGPQDILATRISRLSGTNVLTRVILRHTPPLPDSTKLPVIDFNSTEAFPPVVGNVTVNGVGPEGATSRTRVHTALSENQISFLTSSETAPSRTFSAIPESRLQPNALQVLSATANPTAANIIRSAEVYFRAPVDQTLSLGAPATMPALSTIAATPSLRLRAKFDIQPDYDRLTGITYQQGQSPVVTVSMTAAYAALSNSGYDLIVPDLSTAPGFDARWALRAGEPVSWSAARTGGTLGLGQNAVPRAGATVRLGIIFGEYTP
jgi:hypothetical protein